MKNTPRVSKWHATPLGAAAEAAAAIKIAKYADLTADCIFLPLTFESMSPIISEVLRFIRHLGRRISESFKDISSGIVLIQRLSMAILRLNAVLFEEPFPLPTSMNQRRVDTHSFLPPALFK